MKKGDILGHEFMGEVMEVGDGVHNLKTGDRVLGYAACVVSDTHDIRRDRERSDD